MTRHGADPTMSMGSIDRQLGWCGRMCVLMCALMSALFCPPSLVAAYPSPSKSGKSFFQTFQPLVNLIVE